MRTKNLHIAIFTGNAIQVVNYRDKRELQLISPVSALFTSISSISSGAASAVVSGAFSGFTIVDGKGQEVWRSTSNLILGNLRALALSPSGRNVACQNSRGVCYFDIAVEKAVWVWERDKGGDAGEAQISRSVGWSDKSDELVFSDGKSVWRYNLKTANGRKIGQGVDPTWSSDGNWIAFRAQDGATLLLDTHKEDSVTQLKHVKAVGPLKWSPDGAYVLYERKDEKFSPHKYIDSAGLGSQLVVYRLRDGAECVVLDPMYKGMGRDFGWLSMEASQKK